ncbi:hypothetical protein K438DRAFT_2007735 [Mycena galopus ATCC 62051]|nr:hypothetical protein K438DRAFT_2007735 [Mycena galopus ATCC 62051]
MKIPHDIVEVIVDALAESSLHAFCLASIYFVSSAQTRIFRSLMLRVEGQTGFIPAKGFRFMSPWQAERLFLSSPHLASYVQRLWIDIPPTKRHIDPKAPVGSTDCCPPLQAVLPTFTAARQLVLGGRQWKDLPVALKDIIQSIMLQPSLTEVHLSQIIIPAALIKFTAMFVSAMTLFGVVVEGIDQPMAANPQQTLRTLTLKKITQSMVTFLTMPGALIMQHLLIFYPREVGWSAIGKVLQASAATLTRLSFRVDRRFKAGDVPRLNVLRVLELESEAEPGPYRLPDMFVSLLNNIPSVMPRLEHVTLRITVLVVQDSFRRSRFIGPERSRSAWAHSGPLDMGSAVRAIHCRLSFLDYRPWDFSDARRELRTRVYEEFVCCMGEQMPVLRDNGGLSFSQTMIE